MRLNAQQAAIVDLPITESALVIAGPGSGKTTVIAHRALNLVSDLPEGKSIQMLTFSNKAAKEMKQRIRRFAGVLPQQVQFDTFHSFGLKLLKADPAGYGLDDGFTLMTPNDQKRSLRRLAATHGLPKNLAPEDKKRLDPMAWLTTWSLSRQAGYDVSNPENRAALCRRLTVAHRLYESEVDLAWATLSSYEAEKQRTGVIDFDDLLYMPLLRLAKQDAYRELVREPFAYVIVDECQDTNRIQYEMVRRLSLGWCGVTCVGDDDQSIYGWRGAEVSNMRRFLAHFAAQELRLEENYRSSKAIVDASARLISLNSDRLSKTPFSHGDQGTAPVFERFDNHRDMADSITAQIVARLAEGVAPSEIAVLYRTNRMAMLIEQGLRRSRVQYHVVGGMSLFSRAEVTAVTSAVRLHQNPKDAHALSGLTDYIDGFGAGSARLVSDWLTEDASHSLLNLPHTLPGVSASRVEALRRFMADLSDSVETAETPQQFVGWMIGEPMRLLERESDLELRKKRETHLNALCEDLAFELQERVTNEPGIVWQDLIMEVILRDAQQAEPENGMVTLSTIHRAKGLEFECVFIPGASEGLLPLDSREELTSDEAGFSHVEEERRLAFVAVTRAKRHCTFMHADRYGFAGQTDDRLYEPSRFVQEAGLTIPYEPMRDFEDEHTISAPPATFAAGLSQVLRGL